MNGQLSLTVFALAAVLFFSGWLAPVALAQEEDELVRLLKQSRMDAKMDHLVSTRDVRATYLQPHLHTSAYQDSIRQLIGLEPLIRHVEEPEGFKIESAQAYKRLTKSGFERRFGDTRWTFLGAEGSSVVDTSQTRSIRAALQAEFGSPTRTVAEIDRDGGTPSVDDNIQFEYWIVVNDSIPVQVMDPFGPFDRGIVFASDAEYRDIIRELRRELLEPLLLEERRAPYVDYFYDPESNAWYRAGFDGQRFFTEQVRRSQIQPGQRPTLPN